MSSLPEESALKSDPSPHPWLRYLAKWIDCAITGVLAVKIIFSGSSPVPAYASIFGSILAIFIWMPIEALLLSTIGTSPGRWVTGLRVVGKNGERLTLGDALTRTVNLSFWGLAFAIFPIALFTIYYAYKNLKSTGGTKWDRLANSVVLYTHPGQLKIMLFGLLLVIAAIIAFS